MPLETGDFIPELDDNNPLGADNVSLGDDHIRLLKRTILGTFPAFVGTAAIPKFVAFTEDEINDLPQRTVDESISGRWSFLSTLTARVGTDGFFVNDSANVAGVKMSHDGGNNFAFDFTATPNWNITGLTTALVAGAWTFSDAASVFGGVIGSNLVDKAAAETITGAWDFNERIFLNGAVGNAAAMFVINSAQPNGPFMTWQNAGTSFADIGAGAQLGGGFDPNALGIGGRAGTNLEFAAAGETSPAVRVVALASGSLLAADTGGTLSAVAKIGAAENIQGAWEFRNAGASLRLANGTTISGRDNTSALQSIAQVDTNNLLRFAGQGINTRMDALNQIDIFLAAGIAGRWHTKELGSLSVSDRTDVFRKVAFRNPGRRQINADTTLLQDDEGAIVEGSTGAIVISVATLESGTMIRVMNRSGSPITVVRVGTTFEWYSGSGNPPNADLQLAGGSIMDLTWRSQTTVQVFGNGISVI